MPYIEHFSHDSLNMTFRFQHTPETPPQALRLMQYEGKDWFVPPPTIAVPEVFMFEAKPLIRAALLAQDVFSDDADLPPSYQLPLAILNQDPEDVNLTLAILHGEPLQSLQSKHGARNITLLARRLETAGVVLVERPRAVDPILRTAIEELRNEHEAARRAAQINQQIDGPDASTAPLDTDPDASTTSKVQPPPRAGAYAITQMPADQFEELQRRRNAVTGKYLRRQWPWGTMKVQDFVKIEPEDYKRAQNAVHVYMQKHPGKRFVTERVMATGQLRVTRMPDVLRKEKTV